MPDTEYAMDPAQPSGRPAFLTVLCVLIFVFCGWAAISNFMEAASPPYAVMVQEQMEQAMGQFGSFGGDADSEAMLASITETMMRMVEQARPIAILKGLAALLALLGAWFMWNMRKLGFHLYVVAGILWSFAPMFFLGANMVTWVIALMYGFACLVFTIMFASNLKVMH